MTPAYVNAGTRANSSGATSRTPGLPASLVNGNLLIAVVGSKNNATHSVSGSGWTQLDVQVNSGTGWTVSLWKRIVDGTEAAPTISWTGSVACFGQTIQINGNAASPIGAILSNNGTTSTHSNGGITTTANNSLVIYIDAAAANTAIAQPSGWTERLDNGSSTGATRNANGDKTVATSGSASGAISVTGAAAAWVMWQIEILDSTLTGSIGQNTETDTAQALGRAKQLVFGMGSETDSALGMARAKQLGIGLQTETDSALGMTGAKALGIAQGLESDTALAMTAAKRKTIGLSEESDSALTITPVVTYTLDLGIVTEQDIALPIYAAKLYRDTFAVQARTLEFQTDRRDLTNSANERTTRYKVSQ